MSIRGKKFTKLLSLFIVVMMLGTVIVPTSFGYAKEVTNAEWYNFRNNQENNGITDVNTPTSAKSTNLKWASKFGIGWGAAPTPPLILDGYLYIGVGKEIVKVDKETGKEVMRSPYEMVANVGYAMNPLIYADGKIFAQVGNGMIQAVDYETLEPLWHTEEIGGQTVSPISYTKGSDGKGYIVTGTWNSESKDGEYICVSTDDENVNEGIKEFKWIFRPSGNQSDKDNPDWNLTFDQELKNAEKSSPRGFYWAGAYATPKYIAVGSDDGTSEGDYSANAVFYTLDTETGEVISRVDGIKGDIRTTTVYDNGYLYFSTKGGQLHKIKVDENGNLGEDSYIDLGGMTTASPVVYKNKIYIGVCGKGGQFNSDGGHGFAVVDNSKEKLSSNSELYRIPIKGYPQAGALVSTAHVNDDFNNDGKADGRVYIYFTYNANPGGIYYTYDTPDQSEAAKISAELFIPPKEQQQYCISSLCADKKGTIYYKNDSCYLMAVESNPAYLEDIKVTTDSESAVSWDQTFDSRNGNYIVKVKGEDKYVNLEVKASAGSKVTVNGSEYKGKQKIEISDKPKDVAIKVSNGEYARTYNLKISQTAAITTLSELKVSTSNSYNSNLIPLKNEFSSEVYNYDCDITDQKEDEFYRIWAKSTDPNATVKVLANENVASKRNGEAVEKGTELKLNGTSNKYAAVYRVDKTKSASVTIEVTAENGKAKQNYELRLVEKIPVASIELNPKEVVILENSKIKIKAKVNPIDATYQDLSWSSLDEEVATVDQEGNVTAVKAGETTIAATAENGVVIGKSTVKVISKDSLVNKYLNIIETYKDKSKYNKAQQDEIDNVILEAKTALFSATTETEMMDIVNEAKAKLDKIKTSEQIAKEKAEVVIAKIDAIGTVTFEKETAIADARKTYNSLTSEEQKFVTNYDVLLAAEDSFSKLTVDAPKISVSLNKGAPRITWFKIKYASSYEVYRATSKNGKYSKTYTTSGTSYTNTGAVAGYTYYYKVVAIAKNGNNSEYSNIVSKARSPYDISVKMLYRSVDGKPILNWKDVKTATTYKVYRATSEKGQYSRICTTKGNSYTYKGATPGKTYYYKVRAYNKNDKLVGTSGQIRYKTKVIKPTIKIIKSTKPYIKWTKVSKAYKYEVYRSTVNKTGTFKKQYTTKNISYKNTSAKKGKTYYYKVRAISKDGRKSSFSSVVKIKSKK